MRATWILSITADSTAGAIQADKRLAEYLPCKYTEAIGITDRCPINHAAGLAGK